MREDFIYPQIDLGIMVSDGILERLIEYIPQQKMEEYVAEQMKLARKDKMWLYARQNFKNEDESPWEMSPGELQLYKMIALRKYPRNQVVTSTQYGKTLTIARAVLTRIATYPEEWMTVAPDLKRGKILINYIIKDTVTNEYFKNKLVGLDVGERSSLNRLLEEKSKVKLTFQMIDDDGVQRYGSVEVLTADARRKENAISTIMGFGGRNIICLPFGEKILTDKGYIKIGEVVKDKLNVKICSFNHKTGRVEFKEIEKYEKSEGRDLIEIDVGDKKIICTENHPVWNGKKYVQAKNIKKGNKVWDLG